jgi:bifunctional ADP-heptose synthase (sugar kinase/adenylyltransferase)
MTRSIVAAWDSEVGKGSWASGPGEGMASAKRIICVGHAALDRIYRIEAFPPEPTKVRALEHVECGGGMAANAAVAIARLGGKSELWSRTGDDGAGNAIRAGLKARRWTCAACRASTGPAPPRPPSSSTAKASG